MIVYDINNKIKLILKIKSGWLLVRALVTVGDSWVNRVLTKWQRELSLIDTPHLAPIHIDYADSEYINEITIEALCKTVCTRNRTSNRIATKWRRELARIDAPQLAPIHINYAESDYPKESAIAFSYPQ